MALILRPVKIRGTRSKVVHLAWRGVGLCSSARDAELELLGYGTLGRLCHHCSVASEKMEPA